MGDVDIGARLRELRVGAGLSQRALAARAGVPHGQISMVEQNKVSPSVASLRRIIGGLSMSLSDFFHAREAPRAQVFFSSGDLSDLTSRLGGGDLSGKAVPVLRQVGDARAHNLQILHERYPTGADTGPSQLEHAGCEGGMVIEGRLEVHVGSECRVLGAGEFYLFDSRIPHRFRNIGDDEAVVVSACTPPYL